ncbi:hypothetical protein BC939DRAFT_502351 [Gamsiella multidivaricata]|uniref:uncharacterized protein n=1 Tax=Gamsiella multidivaricata TaxID=101098 RepID=UPI00221E84E0|nr:uncharacterized protein BC939DRAFT_502351 [Gamsiella multidivaricata]KAG0367386.1 hypothetical protein BGZ54_003952 [Gamsiella multidivaricata]KAI7825110.1 hypothetical protein BC939DRAFT_502351 [Gamsiella multidivaricata]
MYPNQAGRVVDKENDIAADSAARAATATLVKQASFVGSRTPSAKQQGLKVNLTKTPSLQGKPSALALNSPTAQGVLRTKTNHQQLSSTLDNNSKDTTAKKKSTLTRTFSAALESNNTNSNSGNTSSALSTPINTESRRRSLTKRGSAKTRLVVHKDDESVTQETNDNIIVNSNSRDNSDNGSRVKPMVALAKAAPIESATTLLSIQRAVESHDKVVVGQAEAETKRRALPNDDENWDIEYCPPPVEEQPYDPEFELDPLALSTVPSALAYHVHSIEDFELGLPSMEPAKIRRPPSPAQSDEEKDEQEQKQEDDKAPMPKSTVTPDGHLDVTWSDDEDTVHPKGGRRFGIKDLEDESKTRPPFDGFFFELDASEDSLSEDEDDIFGGRKHNVPGRKKDDSDKPTKKFNDAIGLGDLEDEKKVEAPFSDFAFEL